MISVTVIILTALLEYFDLLMEWCNKIFTFSHFLAVIML